MKLLRTEIEYILNNQKFNVAWADKNYINRFLPDIKFPHAFVHNISGAFYDENYKLITKEQAFELTLYIPSYDIGTIDFIIIKLNYLNYSKNTRKKTYFSIFGRKSIRLVAFRCLPTAGASHSLRATSILGAKQTPSKHSNANF
jgi:hypothetical protein